MYNALVGYSLFADMHWWTLQRDLTIQNKPLIKLLVLHPTVKVILGVYYLFSIPLSSLATTPTTKSFHSKVFQFKCFLFQIDEMMRLSISDEWDVNFKAWDWSFVTNRKLQMIPIDISINPIKVGWQGWGRKSWFWRIFCSNVIDCSWSQLGLNEFWVFNKLFSRFVI